MYICIYQSIYIYIYIYIYICTWVQVYHRYLHRKKPLQYVTWCRVLQWPGGGCCEHSWSPALFGRLGVVICQNGWKSQFHMENLSPTLWSVYVYIHIYIYMYIDTTNFMGTSPRLNKVLWHQKSYLIKTAKGLRKNPHLDLPPIEEDLSFSQT